MRPLSVAGDLPGNGLLQQREKNAMVTIHLGENEMAEFKCFLWILRYLGTQGQAHFALWIDWIV